MFKNKKKVLAIIPARGGSKGIKLKNIKKINGIPLIAYTAKVVSKSKLIDRAVVSTDNKKIRDISIQFGLDCPFVRPKNLSGPRVPDMPVLVHALKKIEKIDNVRYDIVLMLQPTSPLRSKSILERAIKDLIEEFRSFELLFSEQKKILQDYKYTLERLEQETSRLADTSKEDSNITNAIKMASEGKTIQEISEITGMSREEIEPIIKFHGK